MQKPNGWQRAVQAMHANDEAAFQEAIKTLPNVEQGQGSVNDTLLHKIVRLGLNVSWGAALFVQGPEMINRSNDQGETPLMASIVKPSAGSGMTNTWCEWLLEHGARPDKHDRRRETALHRAARLDGPDALDVLQSLLDHGAKVNVQDGQGNTPLFHAVGSYADPHAVDALLAAGADPRLGRATNPLIVAWERSPDSIYPTLKMAVVRLEQNELRMALPTESPPSTGRRRL